MVSMQHESCANHKFSKENILVCSYMILDIELGIGQTAVFCSIHCVQLLAVMSEAVPLVIVE